MNKLNFLKSGNAVTQHLREKVQFFYFGILAGSAQAL